MPTSNMTKRERFIAAAKGQPVDRPPVWIMRQAGRYMTEYMEIRKTHTFKDLCFNSEICTKVSLLPQNLLGVDALIIFNDILIPLEAMGLSVEFPDQGGPQVTGCPRDEASAEDFQSHIFENPAVCENLRALRKNALPDSAILGFSGAPLTLLGYAVEGKMSRNLDHLKKLLFEKPLLAHELLRRLTETVVSYLVTQVQDGGADAVQLFESLAYVLSPGDLAEFALPYEKEVIRRFKQACPNTPIINFARGGADVLQHQVQSGADVVSVEWTLTLAEARSRVPGNVALQGNLDPMVLTVPESVERYTEIMLEGFDWSTGFIANLGHGITPQAKVEGAKRFVKAIQNLST
ncbi:MAG: uroporphyrinogen decarboxylase [Sumerlaeia bacterium]